MNVADAREPFRCPAQECRNGQLGTDFGDTKHLYRHWYDTHQPRCPRTDCEFHKKNLSKVTRFYFLRHWGYHYPKIVTKSACAKCGGLFVNVANRDRHARKCNGSPVTTAVSTQQDVDHSYATHTIPTLGATTASDNVLNGWLPDPGGPNASSFVQGGTQTALLDISQWSPSWPAESSTSTADLLLTTDDWTKIASTTEDHSSVRSIQYMDSELNTPLLGFGTLQTSFKKQKSIGAGALQHEHDAYSTDGDRLLDVPVPLNWRAMNNMTFVSESDAQLRNSMFQQDDIAPLGSSFDPLLLSRPEPREGIVDQQTQTLGCRTIYGPPMRIHKQYERLYAGEEWSEKRSPSRLVTKRRQVIVVKSYVPSETGYREISSDQQIWVHKLVRKLGHNDPKIIETTTLIINNVLNSKTREPRVRVKRVIRWDVVRGTVAHTS